MLAGILSAGAEFTTVSKVPLAATGLSDVGSASFLLLRQSRLFPVDIFPESAYIICEVSLAYGCEGVNPSDPSVQFLTSFFVEMQ